MMTDLYISLRQQQSNHIPRDLKHTIKAMYTYLLCTDQFKLETVNPVHTSASNYHSRVHKQRPSAWLVNNITFNKDYQLHFGCTTSCEIKRTYRTHRNVTIAHTKTQQNVTFSAQDTQLNTQLLRSTPILALRVEIWTW